MSTKLFAILWVAGMAGVLSLLLIDLPALIANLPGASGSELPFHPLLIKVVSTIQPTILLSLAIFIGIQLAHRVGLSAPAAEALAKGNDFVSALKPQVLPGLIAGFIAGVMIISSWLLFRPLLPPVFITRAERLNTSMPFLMRILYGGVTEEMLLRWGLLTLLVWVLWRIFQQGRGTPRTIYFVSAIVISSVVFGIGHLPLVRALGVDFTVPIVAFVVLANSLFGLIAGYLYWRNGLEAAIIAHMSAHIVLITAIHLFM
ncbi:MAG: type II CAAX prenyl endopeptidase Rce1 family protein [Pyrinomonadaceae bacterium]